MSKHNGELTVNLKTFLMLIMLCLISTQIHAETAYVTDKLYLGMHEKVNSEGKQLKVLISGTKLEILERTKNHAKVRTPEGIIGWTKSAYLVNDIPPKKLLSSLKAKNQALTKQIAIYKNEISSSGNKLAELEDTVSKLSSKLSSQEADLILSKQENMQFKNNMHKYKNSIPLTLASGAMGICLLLGFIGGIAWLDHRNRKRHGGFRI